MTLISGLALTVAVAIGATWFSITASMFHSTLPFEEGERVVAIENWDAAVGTVEQQVMHDFAVWRDELDSVEDMGAWRTIGRNLIVPGGSARPVTAVEMTASGFRLARVSPLFGRTLVGEDEQPGAPPVAVIGYDMWQNRFGGDRGVVGREIRLGSTVYTVVGIMPEKFGFPVNHQFWVPLRADPLDWERRKGPEISVFGRLAPGVTLERAQTELATIGRQC